MIDRLSVVGTAFACVLVVQKDSPSLLYWTRAWQGQYWSLESSTFKYN